MIKATIRTAIAGIVLSVAFASCKNIEQVQVSRIQGFAVSDVSMKGATVKVGLGIKNPNNFRFKIRNAKLDVYIADQVVGNADLKKKIIVPAKSNDVYDFAIRVDFTKAGQALLPSLMDVFQKRKTEVNVKGVLKLRAFGLGKKIPVDFKEKVDLQKYMPQF